MTDPLTPDQLSAIRADVARWDELAHMTVFEFLDARGTEEVNRLKDRYRKAIPGLLATIEAQQRDIERLSSGYDLLTEHVRANP